MSISYKVRYEGGKEQIIPSLHPDDTIDTLKRKIIMNVLPEVPYDSIYLFALKKIAFVPEQLYKELTQNLKFELTYDRLKNFLLNFEEPNLMDKIERKDVYSIGDLYTLQLDKAHFVRIPIGQRFLGNKSTPYLFIVDPLLLKTADEVDEFLLENAGSMISTQNSLLVMDYGDLKDNLFYLVTGEELFKQNDSSSLPNLSPIYFPFLNKRGIDNLSVLRAQNESLLDMNKKLLSTNTQDVFKSVDLFYTLFENSTYPIIQSGIHEIDFYIHQTLKMIIPLEQLFKILHSTKEIPLIKFNPGFRRENLLRLFSEQQTINGTKIPYLSKAMIIKLIKSIGKNKTISLYLQNNLVCSIYEDGSVRVICEMENLVSVEEMEEHVRILINPILETVKSYVEKSGFTYNLFKNFNEENVETVSITYDTKVKLDKDKINLKPYMSCISTVFNVTQDSLTKEGGIKARYKRVANYNEMNAIDAFIRDVINQGIQREGVIEKIKDNFGMSREAAEEKFVAFVNEVEVEQGIFQNRKLRIKDNPGFATSFMREKFTSNLLISMNDISSVRYLKLIPIYISSFLEMVMGKQEELVSDICTRKKLKEEKPVEEIVAPAEQPFGENETPLITGAKELEFGDEGDDDMLDMLLGSDDDEEEDEDQGMSGGGIKSKRGGNDDDDQTGSKMTDITGMSLANPNYFSKRMEDRDPSLFIKKKTGKFNTYSRMCPSNIRRQPVILTQEEKERIDRTHPDSYTHSIKYGSDPKKPYYYICPRYWCIPENTSLSEEEVKAGACGGVDAIIPFDAKKVPKGKTIYEFGADPSDPSAHSYKEYYDEDGNYVQHFPGFIPGSKHPEGKCMPCCFKSWDAKEQVRRRQECSQDDESIKSVAPKRRKQTETQKDYIKGEEKFPLEPNRWGYMPIQLQMFFGEDAKSVQVSTLDPVLKETAVTLLRHGVEAHPTQSFVACIADIFSDYSNEEIKSRMDKELTKLRKELKRVRKGDSKTKEVDAQRITKQITKLQAKPTIKEMKQKIIDMLTIDNFTKYQNGNLIQEFYPGNTEGVSIDDFQDSQLYKYLDTTEESQVEYFEKLIASFKNFINFLSNDEVVIDYQFLWDIISLPNPKLFPNGINLVIFEIPEDDITGNVEIVCPTNHYSNVLYSDKRLTLILVKKDQFFEPIYLYDNMKKNISRFMFREQTLTGKPNIKVALSNIREFLTTKCKPLNSLPRVYKFETNVTLDKAVKELEKHLKKIDSIVINYNGKAIGLHIETKSNGKGFIPVFPSNYEVTSQIPIVFVDEDSDWMNYNQTVGFLKAISKITKLPCSPVCKIIEDGMVVGVLTKTNQMIPLIEPEESPDDDLGDCKTESYKHGLNKELITTTRKDEQRISFIKALNEEKENYSSFRNLARVELNRYQNQSIKHNLQQMIESLDKDSLDSYTDTLFQIMREFQLLLNKIVRFSDGDDVNTDEFIYPKTNKLTKKLNETTYFLRLADEALRYQRIKLFLFEKEKYLSFSDMLYKINKNEILILESMINSDYFEGLKAFTRNKFVHFNTYDTAQPIITAPYSSEIIVDKCSVKSQSITTGYLGKLFSNDYSYISFGDSKKDSRSTMCSFELIITILKDVGKPLEKNDIQQILAEKYREYPEDKILKILYEEGKEQWIKMIRGGNISLDEFIMSEHYYLTLLDLWMITLLFDIPILFFGIYNNKVNNKKAFATIRPKNQNTSYYLIRTFAPKQNTIPKYGLIESPLKKLAIPVGVIPKNKDIYVAFEIKDKKYMIPSIDEYIQK